MMDYEMFKDVVREKLMSLMPDELAGYSLRADRTGKVNETLDALHLVPPDCLPDKLYPTVYLNHVYEEYKKSGDLQGTLELTAFYMAGACREAERKNSRINLQGAPESIVMSLVNTQQNREMLGYMPHREFEDLSMELMELLRKNNMKEAANSIFEMAAYVDVMEKKMDSVLGELRTVKDQLHKMEEREAEKGLKQTLKRAVDKLEQDCKAMKEKLLEVKAEIKAKAGEIVTAAKQKGKAALNRVSEFLGIKKKLEGIRQNVQESIADVDKSIGKIDAFGTGMREAGQKVANTFRTFADKPEKEYREKKFSKTELIKKPFQAKRKLMSGILNCADAAIEKTEQLAADVKQYQTDKAERETGGIDNMEAVNPMEFARVAEPEFRYGAEAFEVYERENKKKAADALAKEARKPATTKSRYSRKGCGSKISCPF